MSFEINDHIIAITHRIRDVALAVTLLLLTWPIIVLCALVVIADSGFPVFFRQTRIGIRRQPFTLLKLRTMTSDPTEESGFEAGSTRRVTRVGRFLRRLKLDELPQLINVIRGDISLVGPRPEVPDWVNQSPNMFDQIMDFKPGLTDPASIVFRDEERLLSRFENPDLAYKELLLPIKIELSSQYLHNRTVWSDLVVLWATFAVLFGLPHPWNHIDASSLLQARHNKLNAKGCR